MRLLVILFISITSVAQGQERRFHQELLAAIDTGNYDLAISKLDFHLEKHPYDYYAYKIRASARKNLPELKEAAITDYNIYLEYFPEDDEALFDRGLLRYTTGMFSLALEDFLYLSKYASPEETTSIYFQSSLNSNQATKIFTVQEGVKPLFYYYTGACYYNLQLADSALVWYETALQFNPNNIDFLIAKALALEKKQQYSLAIDSYKRTLELDPHHGLANSNLGSLLNRLGRKEEAEKYIKASIYNEPELAYPYGERGYNLLQSGNYRQALAEYNKALAIAPENHEYLLNRGKTYLQLWQLADAKKDFQRVMDIKPANEQAYFNMAIAEYREGNFREAKDLLDIAILYYPEYAYAYYNRAIVYNKLNEKTQACSDLERAAALGIDIPQKMFDGICD